MKIKVTEVHIAKGTPENPFCCPIALAAIDAGVVDPSVTGKTMSYGYDKKRVLLPGAVSLFVIEYDNHRPVAPFEFEVELP